MHSLANIHKAAIFLALVLTLVSIAALAENQANIAPPAPTLLTVDGTLIKGNLEGGCWYFETDKGVRYEPDFGAGIPKDLSSGQRLTVKGYAQDAKNSICMVGPGLKITDYKKLGANQKGILDGKVFTGTMTIKVQSGAPQGDIRPIQETISFSEGMIQSAVFGSEGYKPSPYVAKKKGDKIIFTAKALSDAAPGEALEWSGTVMKDKTIAATTLIGTAKVIGKSGKQTRGYAIRATLSITDTPMSK